MKLWHVLNLGLRTQQVLRSGVQDDISRSHRLERSVSGTLNCTERSGLYVRDALIRLEAPILSGRPLSEERLLSEEFGQLLN